MSDTNTYKFEPKWREADIAAKEERVSTIDIWLFHTEDLVEMLEDDSKICSEIRGLLGGIRKKRNDVSSEMERLRAALVDRGRNQEKA